ADLNIAPIYKAPPAVATWAGSYVGVAGGGAWGGAVLRDNATGVEPTPRTNLSGGIVGVTSGLPIPTGNWLIGFEGDISPANTRAALSQFPPTALSPKAVKNTALPPSAAPAAPGPKTGPATPPAGGAPANAATTLVIPAGTISDQQWHWGWTAGGGVELKLS